MTTAITRFGRISSASGREGDDLASLAPLSASLAAAGALAEASEAHLEALASPAELLEQASELVEALAELTHLLFGGLLPCHSVDVLAELLLARQEAGEINVVDEGQAWHLCLAPTARRRYRRAYEAEKGI